jgi:hypothetical protein
MTDPHEVAPDENPEQHIGEVLPDPWGPYVPQDSGETPVAEQLTAEGF